MSASNWATCPRCYDRARKEHEAKLEALAAAYGSVDRDAWEAMRAAIPDAPRPDSFDSFREDYEIYGAVEGTISVRYSGYCEVCKLGLDFKDERPFYESTVREETAA